MDSEVNIPTKKDGRGRPKGSKNKTVDVEKVDNTIILKRPAINFSPDGWKAYITTQALISFIYALEKEKDKVFDIVGKYSNSNGIDKMAIRNDVWEQITSPKNKKIHDLEQTIKSRNEKISQQEEVIKNLNKIITSKPLIKGTLTKSEIVRALVNHASGYKKELRKCIKEKDYNAASVLDARVETFETAIKYAKEFKAN